MFGLLGGALFLELFFSGLRGFFFYFVFKLVAENVLRFMSSKCEVFWFSLFI